MMTHMRQLCLCAALGMFGCDYAADVPGDTNQVSAAMTQEAGATRLAIPGVIEAEQYRTGGEGVGYHDATPGNAGGAYRTDDVDIQAFDGGGYLVGWIDTGEWLQYDVQVAQSADYVMELRVARAWYDANSYCHIEMDGVNISGRVFIPNTGGFQNFQTVKTDPVRLSAGDHVMTIVMDGNTFNLDSVRFTGGTQAGDGVVAEENRITWNPGVRTEFPYRSTVVNVRTYGARGDGSSNDTNSFNSALATIPAEGGILYIPAGRYLLTSTINLNRSIVLRGEGASKTRLLFSLPASGGRYHCIAITKDVRNAFTAIQSGATRGSRTLTVASGSGFKAGDLVEIEENNDAGTMYTSSQWNQGWAANAVGQTAVVESVSGNSVRIDTPLYTTYKPSLQPRMRMRDFVKYAGVERLALELTRGTQGGDNIYVNYGAYCRFMNIESVGCSGYDSHIRLQNAYRCEVRGSYLHGSNHPDGRGYGVETFHATDCLVEDNIFHTMSSPLMCHVGSSGNVYAYNYDFKPTYYWGGASLHGHYPNYNLFEANVSGGLDAGDWWGPAGPGNIYLRNRALLAGVRVMDHSNDQSIIGNVLMRSQDSILVEPTCLRTIVHGNYVKGNIQWDPSKPRAIPVSYYHTSKPAFLGSKPWPVIDPAAPGQGTIPAQDRYAAGKPVAD